MSVSSREPRARLLGLGTAVPPHPMPQEVVEANARRLLGPQHPEFGRLAASFRRAGIDMRYSVVPLDWFEAPKDWPARSEAFLDGGTALFGAAAERALAAAGLAAGEIDAIVTVSSTGIATPTLEARMQARMGFRTDVQRVPVFGLGCAGGVTGLSLAARLAAAMPGQRVLMVAVETCTLAFRGRAPGKADIVATMLFGDGAAAACISTAGEGPALGTGIEHTWPDTLSIMGWTVEPDGLGVVFDRSIPAFVKEHLDMVVRQAAERLGLPLERLARLVCHPGGARVVEAIESALALGQGSLDHERDVLRRYGNMSSPTVLFVLDRVLGSGLRGKMMLAALGPGFTSSLLAIEVE